MSNGTKTRQATLQLSQSPTGQLLTARVPSDLTEEDFKKVGQAAFGMIHKLTGCNCMSGRISFVVEDNFADVIRVDLGAQGAVQGLRQV